MKKVLFIGATHGNETIGLDALRIIGSRSNYDFLVGNPRAKEKNIRFTEYDLNRAGLGDPTAPEYEKRRAVEIQNQASNYEYTIDLHGTHQTTGVFLLVTNPSLANLRLASFFEIPNLVIWPSITPEMQYPMSEFFSSGIEIESGPQTNPQTTLELAAYLKDFLENLTERQTNSDWIKRLEQKKLWEMCGSIPTEPNLSEKLKEFELVNHNGETFAPIFVGTYKYENILGYKLKPYTPEEFKTKFLPYQL